MREFVSGKGAHSHSGVFFRNVSIPSNRPLCAVWMALDLWRRRSIPRRVARVELVRVEDAEGHIVLHPVHPYFASAARHGDLVLHRVIYALPNAFKIANAYMIRSNSTAMREWV